MRQLKIGPLTLWGLFRGCAPLGWRNGRQSAHAAPAAPQARASLTHAPVFALRKVIATMAIAGIAFFSPFSFANEPRLPKTTGLVAFQKDRGALRRYNELTPDKVAAFRQGPFRDEFGDPAPYPEVEASLQALADSILKSSGLEPRIQVVLDDCSDLTIAEGRKEGILRLCRGTLSLFQSQDHLAFLMSHEIAHILLQHGRRDWRIGASQGASVLGTLAFMVAGGSTGMGWLPFMPAINQALVTPSRVISGYRPAEEREADFLGVDLAIAAGFSPAEILCGAKFFLVADASGASDCRPLASRAGETGGVWGRIFGTNVKAVTHDEDGVRYAALEAYLAKFHASAPDVEPRALLPGANGATNPQVAALLAAQQATMRVQVDLYRLTVVSISPQATPGDIADARATCAAGRTTLAGAKSPGRLSPQDRGLRRLQAALYFACGDRIGGARAFAEVLAPVRAEAGRPVSDAIVLEAYALGDLADDDATRARAAEAWLAGAAGQTTTSYWNGRFRGACMLNSAHLLDAVTTACKEATGASAYCEASAQEIRDADTCSKGLFDIYRDDASPQGYLRVRSAIYGDVLHRQLYP